MIGLCVLHIKARQCACKHAAFTAWLGSAEASESGPCVFHAYSISLCAFVHIVYDFPVLGARHARRNPTGLIDCLEVGQAALNIMPCAQTQASMSSTEQLRQQLADMERRCDVALEIIVCARTHARLCVHQRCRHILGFDVAWDVQGATACRAPYSVQVTRLGIHLLDEALLKQRNAWTLCHYVDSLLHASPGYYPLCQQSGCLCHKVFSAGRFDVLCLCSFSYTEMSFNMVITTARQVSARQPPMRYDLSLLVEGRCERNERVEQIEEDLKDCRAIFHEQNLWHRLMLGKAGHKD
eukprot:980400-Pelagomonas_calceolata.AAC.1